MQLCGKPKTNGCFPTLQSLQHFFCASPFAARSLSSHPLSHQTKRGDQNTCFFTNKEQNSLKKQIKTMRVFSLFEFPNFKEVARFSMQSSHAPLVVADEPILVVSSSLSSPFRNGNSQAYHLLLLLSVLFPFVPTFYRQQERKSLHTVGFLFPGNQCRENKRKNEQDSTM